MFTGHPNEDPCLWRLEWHTKAACPKSTQSSKQTSDKKFPDGSDYYPKATSSVARGFGCKVTEPVTGAKYDLNPLGSLLELSDVESGYDFVLEICGGFGSGDGPGFSFYSGNASCFSGVGKSFKNLK